ncbi:type II toxin-antitoxin system ParD family antitoxin [Dyella sp. ASV21]|uniref:ribbon-helix-helix domain-containing protein n=1 Tax=Dyella sp. ASV21 TaxID=2795114 RepID=UPI0018EADDB2|nr:type II toxin-antitoxin system ParD family antitoxin [Dyella sp. ASV21]
MSAPHRKTVPLTITLPHEQLEMVRALVASGGYATDSEVIREGLRLLKAREQATERWLLHQVIPAYKRLKEEPSSAMSVDQVRAALLQRQKEKT